MADVAAAMHAADRVNVKTDYQQHAMAGGGSSGGPERQPSADGVAQDNSSNDFHFSAKPRGGTAAAPGFAKNIPRPKRGTSMIRRRTSKLFASRESWQVDAREAERTHKKREHAQWLREARVSYLKALHLDPLDTGMARINLGYTLQEEGNLCAAVMVFSSVAGQVITGRTEGGGRRPADEKMRRMLGRASLEGRAIAMLSLDKPRAAKRDIDVAVALGSGSIVAAAAALSGRGPAIRPTLWNDEDPAVARRRQDLAEYLSNRGVIHQSFRDVKSAECDYRAALDADPFYADARYNLATLLLRVGRLVESVEHFDAVIAYREAEIARRKAAARGETAKWARVADDIGDDQSDGSGGDLRPSRRAKKHAGMRRGRGRGRLQNQRRPPHMTTEPTAAARDSDGSQSDGVGPDRLTGQNDGKFWSTSFHLDQSKQDKEVRAQSEVSASDAMARINRGVAYVRLHRFEDALEDFNAAIEAAPDNAHVHFNRALLYQRMGRPVEAERDLNAAVALKPTEAELYIQRGNAVVLQHRHALEKNADSGKMRLKDAMSDYATALYLR